MSRRGTSDLAGENRRNAPITGPKGGMKQKRSPKKQTKSTQIAADTSDAVYVDPIIELEKKYKALDQFQMEKEVTIVEHGRALAPSEVARLLDHIQSHPVGGRKPSNSARNEATEGSSGTPQSERHFEESSSQATTSDMLPSSETFFSDKPIASNNDFEPSTDVTGSRITSTGSVRGEGSFSRSVAGAGALMDVDIPVSESTASVATQNRVGNEDLRKLLFSQYVQPSDDLLDSSISPDKLDSSSKASVSRAGTRKRGSSTPQPKKEPKQDEDKPSTPPSTPKPRRSARLSLSPHS